MSSPAQLVLGIGLRDDATLENFLFGAELAALEGVLREMAANTGEEVVYLCGSAGSGRSHLLQAVCREYPVGEAMYVPLKDFAAAPAQDILENVERMALLCLDDIDQIAGDSNWEEAIFHSFNRARSAGCRLLLSGAQPPPELPLELADLRSRLGWGVTLQIAAPDDRRKLEILQFRASRRGLQMADDVGRYMLNRAPRSLEKLVLLLDQLDRESMVQQRALSIPFVKQCLGW